MEDFTATEKQGQLDNLTDEDLLAELVRRGFKELTPEEDEVLAYYREEGFYLSLSQQIQLIIDNQTLQRNNYLLMCFLSKRFEPIREKENYTIADCKEILEMQGPLMALEITPTLQSLTRSYQEWEGLPQKKGRGRPSKDEGIRLTKDEVPVFLDFYVFTWQRNQRRNHTKE